MTRALRSAIVALLLMAAALASGEMLQPTVKLAQISGPFNLEKVIPEAFGHWQQDQRPALMIVNPQQQQIIDHLYAQVLNRVYHNDQGQRVMLTIAYGEDQRDSLQVHIPDVCYPAQGFTIDSKSAGHLNTPYGNIPVERLVTNLADRWEPLTYWTTVGDQAISSLGQKKLVELHYGLKREIPDGLLFRVSTIDRDSVRAYEIQTAFVSELLSSLSVEGRARLAGLSR